MSVNDSYPLLNTMLIQTYTKIEGFSNEKWQLLGIYNPNTKSWISVQEPDCKNLNFQACVPGQISDIPPVAFAFKPNSNM